MHERLLPEQLRRSAWQGRCAVDGTMMCCSDTAANHGGTGYPMVRLLTLVACGTRTVIAATFGTDQVAETGYVHDLFGALRRHG